MAEVHARRSVDLGTSNAATSSPLLLVVDDEPTVCEFLCDYARASGYRAAACTSGREALAFLDQQPVDLALVDLRMPGIDGLDLIDAMRQRYPDCQVVLMSGFGTIATAVEAVKRGARDYVEKPFDPATLQTLLDTVKREVDSRRPMDL